MCAPSRRPDVHATSYGTALGYRPLREQLRVKLTDFGIATTPDQIILTHGATQALDIVTRTLIQPGDCVFVDDPGYWNLFANLRLYGANLVGVPRGDDGPDPEALEALLGSTSRRPSTRIRCCTIRPRATSRRPPPSVCCNSQKSMIS